MSPTTSTAADRVLRVDELLLRPWQSGDEGEILRGFGDLSIRRYAAGVVDTAADAELFVRRRVDSWAAGTGASWAVTNASSGTVLGHVGLHVVDAHLELAMIGYWLLPRARGRGVGTRALVEASAYGFTSLGLHRIELAHAIENTASCALAERAGYPYEGTLRQAMRYPFDDRWSDEHLHARLASD